MSNTVFSSVREVSLSGFELPVGLTLNSRQQMEGLSMLYKLPQAVIVATFFDPQYRGILDQMGYGNEGRSRLKARCTLKQMDDQTIARFIVEIDRVLIPKGHLFLWVDKFLLCTGIRSWLMDTSLRVVDLITWDKERMGMGYRTRRTCEYMLVLQKAPLRAKGVWSIHDIPDVWRERVSNSRGKVHRKPIGLQKRLIEAVTEEGDIILDPAAGSFSVLESCELCGRNFLGCDVLVC